MSENTLSTLSSLSLLSARAIALILAVLSWPLARLAAGGGPDDGHPWLFAAMLFLGLLVAAAVWLANLCTKKFLDE